VRRDRLVDRLDDEFVEAMIRSPDRRLESPLDVADGLSPPVAVGKDRVVGSLARARALCALSSSRSASGRSTCRAPASVFAARIVTTPAARFASRQSSAHA